MVQGLFLTPLVILIVDTILMCLRQIAVSAASDASGSRTGDADSAAIWPLPFQFKTTWLNRALSTGHALVKITAVVAVAPQRELHPCCGAEAIGAHRKCVAPIALCHNCISPGRTRSACRQGNLKTEI